MPGYVPPGGNAITFNFVGVYAPPPGNAMVLDFVLGSPGSGTAVDQLPGKRRSLAQSFFDEEDWVYIRRRFAPADGYGGEVQPPRSRLAPSWVKYEEEPQLPWRRPRRFVDSNALYRRKRAAQIIG